MSGTGQEREDWAAVDGLERGTGGVLRSPLRPVAFWARHFPSITLYLRMLSLYIRAGTQAQSGVYSGADWARGSLEAVRHLEHVGCRFEVEGLEQVMRLKTPCVFAANHMSTLETICLPALIQPYCDVTFVVKRGLFKYPFFKHILAARDVVAVDRKNARDDLRQVLDAGGARLAAGRSIIVFPQSTRYQQFDPARFNSIAVKLAKHAGVPVLPVALYTSAWGEGRLISDFGAIRPERPVRFRFGAPLAIAGNGKAEHEAVLRFIGDTLAAWAARPAITA